DHREAFDGGAERGGGIEHLLRPASWIETEGACHEVIAPEVVLETRLIDHTHLRRFELVPQLVANCGVEFADLQFSVCPDGVACRPPEMINLLVREREVSLEELAENPTPEPVRREGPSGADGQVEEEGPLVDRS